MTDHATENECHSPALTSRREFLLATGTAATLGLPPVAASTPATDEITIDGSATQLRRAQQTKERVQRNHPSVRVSLDGSGTTAAFRRFTAGNLDVAVGTRPFLPREHDHAISNDIAYIHHEIPRDTRALVRPEQTWYECLSAAQLVDRWADDPAIETWAEITTDETSPLVTTDQSASPRIETPGGTRSSHHLRDRTILVRGVRSYQYATGSGGLGYYEPNSNDLRIVSHGDEASTERASIVRLVYLYATRTALQRPAVTTFIRNYTSLPEEPTTRISYYSDPHNIE